MYDGRPMNRTIPFDALRPWILSSLLAAALPACGGAPATPPAPTAAPAPPPAPTAASTADAADLAKKKEAAVACLAAANAGRAKSSFEPPKIGVKHLLVKYKGAKKADDAVTRTREEACLRAIEARDKVREGADFAEVVKQYSEEPGGASRGGSLGSVERKDLVKPFADAAFELSVNMLSDVVETEFGFHVILRTE